MPLIRAVMMVTGFPQAATETRSRSWASRSWRVGESVLAGCWRGGWGGWRPGGGPGPWLADGLADDLRLAIVPVLLGGPAPAARRRFGGLGPGVLNDAARRAVGLHYQRR